MITHLWSLINAQVFLKFLTTRLIDLNVFGSTIAPLIHGLFPGIND